MSDNDMYIDEETLDLAKQLAEKKRIAKEKKEQKERGIKSVRKKETRKRSRSR